MNKLLLLLHRFISSLISSTCSIPLMLMGTVLLLLTVVGFAGLSSAPPGEVPKTDEGDIPPVQVFAPGFSVQELPLSLPNINVLWGGRSAVRTGL